MAQKVEKNVQTPAAEADVANKTTIRQDFSKMQTVYANVCNASSTREEFMFLFGINQGWNPEQRELTVAISNRVILNPYAAKRLSLLLQNVIRQHESRFGEIRLDLPAKPGEGV